MSKNLSAQSTKLEMSSIPMFLGWSFDEVAFQDNSEKLYSVISLKHFTIMTLAPNKTVNIIFTPVTMAVSM